jgi:O-antigen ligase
MTARIDSGEGVWLAGLLLFAASVGLLAGINPVMAIGAAIAAGFVLIVFVDLPLGLALFTAFSLLEGLGLSSIVSIGKVGGILLALSWFAVVVTRPEAKSDFFSVHPGMTAVIAAFLGWTLLSTVWAESPSVALSAFGRYLLNAMLFLIIFTAVRTKRQALMVAAAFVIGALATSAYGVISGAPVTDYGTARLAGTGVEQGELAAVLISAAALAIGVAANIRRGQPGLRLLAIAAVPACLYAMFLTVSRGGVVGLGVALIAAVLLSGRWRTRVFVVVIVIAVGTYYYFAAFAPEAARERIAATTSSQTENQEGRTTLWTVGERMARANFIKGVGAGNYQVESLHYLVSPGVVTRSDQVLLNDPQPVHNTWLQILAEEGIIGLSLFVTIVGFALASCWRAAKEFARRNDRGGEILARVLLIGLFGTLVADTFLSQEYNKQLWLLLGIGPALLGAARAEASVRSKSYAAEPAPRALAAYSSS